MILYDYLRLINVMRYEIEIGRLAGGRTWTDQAMVERSCRGHRGRRRGGTLYCWFGAQHTVLPRPAGLEPSKYAPRLSQSLSNKTRKTRVIESLHEIKTLEDWKGLINLIINKWWRFLPSGGPLTPSMVFPHQPDGHGTTLMPNWRVPPVVPL